MKTKLSTNPLANRLCEAATPERIHAIKRVLFPDYWAQSLGTTLDPWQVKLVRDDAPQIAANTSRQIGKTEAIAIRITHKAIYNPGTTYVLIAGTERQSSELFSRCKYYLRQANFPRDPTDDLKTRCTLVNGSRIISLPNNPDGVRGIPSVSELALDECAYLEQSMFDASLPMLMKTDGTLVLTSTPAGMAGPFYEACHNPAFSVHTVPVYECSWATPEFIEKQKDRLGPNGFATEHECKFREDATSFLSWSAFDEAFEDEDDMPAGIAQFLQTSGD